MSQLKALKEKRASTHAQAVELLKKEQTAEIRAQVAAIFVDVDAMGADIANIERADKIAAELAAASGAVPGAPTGKSADEQKKEYERAYSDYILKGVRGSRATVKGGASPDSIRLLDETKAAFANMTKEQRDQQAGTQSITYTEGNVGGYFVPAGFVNDIDTATKWFAPLLDGSTIRIMETASGQVLPYPTSNDTNEAWTLLSETTQVVDGGTSPNYPTVGSAPGANPGNVLAGQVVFGAYKGTTGLVRVSLELMQDSAFSIEAFLKEAFAQRLGRGYEYYLTLGTGTNAPLGILPAIAASGSTPIVAAGSSANSGGAETGVNSIGYADLVNLVHSVDPSYRRNAKFMFADSTLAHLKTRLDKFGRPIWVPAVKDGEPDTICGFGYTINQCFPTIAASAKSVAFGAWSKFIARKVRDLSIVRLDERFADYGEVAYVGFSRIDSRLVDAGTHPLNYLVQHS